ncbi:MAG: ATP-binding protein [Candidatus Omnitrophica bacterium]|nr:ATP-binding protein [Candidatus Omnitrophota bacterium]MDD5573673.1 ATP-binding protein [Candidatus Omnitrophota bacterium]
MPPTSTFSAPTGLEVFISYIGMVGMVAVIVLVIILVFKMERIRELQAERNKLKRAFEELDGQAKLIVQTDVELHKTQEELDKKISGLVTLQKLSRLISTTLDEEEIFKKLDEKHITELGFDRALVFCHDEAKNYQCKAAVGYSGEEAERIMKLMTGMPLLMDIVMKQHKIVSSMDMDRAAKETPHLLSMLGLSSFVCAPMMQKEGAIGLLLLGSESPYTRMTEGDKDIVYILATQIGQTLENAKLFEGTWRAQQELENKIQIRTRELSAALEEIKVISKRKSDFINAVSHELRTPLTSIKGYASILAAGKLGELPPAAKERVEKINKHSDNLSDLINGLLDISRIESGRVEMKMEPLDILAMAQSLADMLAPPMKDKNVEFVINMPEGLPQVKADKGQLERVFINLIGNAIKFTPPGGRITVSARPAENAMVQVGVSDTGIGISEHDLKKLGEEFFRVDNDVNAKVKGTGLGLSLVKRIIEAHKGVFSISSQLNHGSTFSFTLPQSQ